VQRVYKSSTITSGGRYEVNGRNAVKAALPNSPAIRPEGSNSKDKRRGGTKKEYNIRVIR